jgi:hypothetical protein
MLGRGRKRKQKKGCAFWIHRRHSNKEIVILIFLFVFPCAEHKEERPKVKIKKLEQSLVEGRVHYYFFTSQKYIQLHTIN